MGQRDSTGVQKLKLDLIGAEPVLISDITYSPPHTHTTRSDH